MTPGGTSDKKFIFIAAGQEKGNLAIGMDNENNQVYKFGHRTVARTTTGQHNSSIARGDTEEEFHEALFEKVETKDPSSLYTLQAQYVSVGTDHYGAIDKHQGQVYTWGRNADGKCGIRGFKEEAAGVKVGYNTPLKQVKFDEQVNHPTKVPLFNHYRKNYVRKVKFEGGA